MARIAPEAGHDPNTELRTVLKDLVASLEKTLADPAHTLTLAHRDQLELTYGQALRLRELMNALLQPSSGKPAVNAVSSPPAKTPLEVKDQSRRQPNFDEGAVNAMSEGKQKHGQPSATSSRRILVVDDRVDGARSLATLLRIQGHQVETAHDGPAAIETARTFGPDIVLLDIGLPGMSGYEVAKHLRQEPARKNMLLVALTGYGQPEDRLRSSEAGFDSHLVKPASLKALTSIISLSHSTQ
jgi:CheY-like chemotaxis protein